MDKIRENFKILQKIFKESHSKKQNCLLCNEKAINSHVLQKNGILSLISDKNHVIQIKGKDFFSADENGILDIKSIGINNAMSYPLFCNFHDTNIFAPIEKQELNLDDSTNQSLFSYRALCAEIRKKIINVDVFEKVCNSSQFNSNIVFISMSKMQIEANNMGIRDMNWYKKEFEKEFAKPADKSNFIFKKIDFDLIPVSISAVYSPINPSVHTMDVLTSKKNILNYIFINLIPQNDKLILVLGYHKQKSDSWIIEFINSWESLNKIEFENKLTDLLATKIETWCISPSYFSTLKHKNIELFKRYWNEHAMDLRITQKINFNLFE